MRARVIEALFFFRQHWQALLWVLAPVLVPLSLFQNHRFYFVHAGSVELASKDGLALGVQLMGGLLANALTILYCLQQVRPAEAAVLLGGRPLWQEALVRAPLLFLVQMLAAVAILGGLLFLVIPGIWLAGVFLPAYVLVTVERPSPLGAMQAAWERFRPGAWPLAGSLGLLLLGLLPALALIGALETSLAGLGSGPAWVLGSVLDVGAMLLTQLISILLVRFYDLERSANERPANDGGEA